MGVEHGASGRRSLRVEAEVPGTIKEAWEAIATGPGIGSWLLSLYLYGDQAATAVSAEVVWRAWVKARFP